MYYIELGKFGKALKEGRIKQNDLAQWCDFISEPRNPSEPLEDRFLNNQGIKEVFAMLQEFTEDDRLREQYRLQHEWLRNQRYEEYAKKKLTDELKKLRKQQKEFEKEIRKREEAERKTEEAERKRKEAERKTEEIEREKKEAERKTEEIEREKKEVERKSILEFRKRGLSDKEIAELLGVSENTVGQIVK